MKNKVAALIGLIVSSAWASSVYAAEDFDVYALRAERAYRQAHFAEAKKIFLLAYDSAKTPSERVIALNSAGDCEFMGLRDQLAAESYNRALIICQAERELIQSSLSCASLNNLAAAKLEETKIEEARSLLSRGQCLSATTDMTTRELPLSPWLINQARVDLQPSSLLTQKHFERSPLSVLSALARGTPVKDRAVELTTGYRSPWYGAPSDILMHWPGFNALETLFCEALKSDDMREASTYLSHRTERTVLDMCGANSKEFARYKLVKKEWNVGEESCRRQLRTSSGERLSLLSPDEVHDLCDRCLNLLSAPNGDR